MAAAGEDVRGSKRCGVCFKAVLGPRATDAELTGLDIETLDRLALAQKTGQSLMLDLEPYLVGPRPVICNGRASGPRNRRRSSRTVNTETGEISNGNLGPVTGDIEP